MKCDSIPFSELPIFHSLIKDYLSENEDLIDLVQDFPSIDSIIKRANNRRFEPSQRERLYNVLKDQYIDYDLGEQVLKNLDSLNKDSTYTITTGHQLCLNLGPMYLIYKIASIISLCEKLNTNQKDKKFVPVFWLASEDHDFEEVNHFNLFNGRYVWKNNLNGAVGEMSTDGIADMLEEVKADFNLTDRAISWIDLAEKAYQKKDLSGATRYFVHELFKDYGLIIIDANHTEFKSEFANVMKSELTDRNAIDVTSKNVNFLSNNSYKVQVNPREINLFYLDENSRERIVYEDATFKVLNSKLEFTEKEILEKLDNFPNKFSPNVILRPLYQESILPNVCTIGGGGEISYWLELKDLFTEREVDFPILLIRDSALFLREKSFNLLEESGFDVIDLFEDKEQLKSKIASSDLNVEMDSYSEKIKELYSQLSQKLIPIDKSLDQAVSVELNKSLKGLNQIEKRMIRSLKERNEVKINRLMRVIDEVFPNGTFQERHINPLQILLTFDVDLIDLLIVNFNPLDKKLKLVIE